MRRCDYLSMVEFVESQRVWDPREALDHLTKLHPDQKLETIRSVVSQVYKDRVKKTNSYHRSARRKRELYQAVKKEMARAGYQLGVIQRLARGRNCSPALAARLVIEEFLKESTGVEDVAEGEVSQLSKNPHLISDPKLGLEVKHCSWSDDTYGYYTDCVRALIGVEYEERLKKTLRERGIAFKDEDDLRRKGLDKTPDVKLVSPIYVKGAGVVNWVESKALFGDERTHAEHIKKQLSSYWNRFGPGMVVYWFGFVDEIAADDLSSTKRRRRIRQGGIVVREDFPKPEEVMLMDPMWDLKTAEEEALHEEDVEALK